MNSTLKMSTRLWYKKIVFVIFIALPSIVWSETCTQSGAYYSYCEEGYYCCNDNTQCCREGLSTLAIVGFVLGSIFLLACCISCCVAFYKCCKMKKNEVQHTQSNDNNRQTISACLSVVKGEVCKKDAENKSYCADVGHYCCEDETKCCREDFEAFKIISIVICGIIAIPFLIVGIGCCIHFLKTLKKKANKDTIDPAVAQNRQTALATQY